MPRDSKGEKLRHYPKVGSVSRDYFPQRDLAAFLAISLRRLAVMPSARALPPMRPSATAAGFLPSSVVMSSISPVAILAIMTALPMASAGCFSPLVPLALAVSFSSNRWRADDGGRRVVRERPEDAKAGARFRIRRGQPFGLR